MFIILSPSKTQKYNTETLPEKATNVMFPDHIKKLVAQLKNLDESELSKLLKISPNLASKAASYYRDFDVGNFDYKGKQALFAYHGDVYESLQADTLAICSLNYLKKHLLILSGLYGLVRPFDLIQAYRLEMGSKVYVDNQVLCKYWRNIITDKINELVALNKFEFIVNLASDEYSQAIVKNNLKAQLINIRFLEYQNNEYKTIGIYAKKARGKMARFLAINNITEEKPIKDFNEGGYSFVKKFSSNDTYSFSRDKPN
jgi:cytoplasmic iron level regulating protein YaaA (DUF328/UPF0246 family)